MNCTLQFPDMKLYSVFVILLIAVVVRAEDAPQVFLDKNPRIVAYQLKRLTNAQLIALERKTDDPKYRPVYEAILTRKGLERKVRQEAVAGLVKLNNSDSVVELLKALGTVEDGDKATPHELLAMLMASTPETLRKQRERIQALATEAESELVKQAAYAALAAADGTPNQVWKMAAENDGGLKLLLGGIKIILDGKVRAAFFPLVKPVISQGADAATQVAAIEAIGMMPTHDAEAFTLLAEIIRGGPGERRDGAVRSMRFIPTASLPKDQVTAVVNTIIEIIRQATPEQRTGPAIVQAVQLGNDLAAALPLEQGLAIRRTLRELAVRVVVIRTLREQMLYDQRYFVVQVGKPVQIILENGDAMPHNLVVTTPTGMAEVVLASSAIIPTGDPNEKAYVPKSAKVIQSTPLVQADESAALSFNAPAAAGEYPYVCTFPGHAVRMYGVMLVVDDLDAWDRNPKAPMDPLTHKPIEKQKNEAGDMPIHEH